MASQKAEINTLGISSEETNHGAGSLPQLCRSRHPSRCAQTLMTRMSGPRGPQASLWLWPILQQQPGTL